MAVFLTSACSNKRESLSETDLISEDSLAGNEVSEDILDEFEYEADSVDTEEGEN
ncbi:MAG: hypothetical protein ACJ75J_03140 [Cytophagaceae bacterium]